MFQEIKKLINGNKEFRKKFFSQESSLFDTLQHGQKPKTMIIACSDSRVDPAMIFDCQPGELFVIRNVANLVPPCENNNTYHGTSAALEFGTCFLEVRNIIILGHTRCGGIQALLQSTDKVLSKEYHGFIAKWMEIARPAYDKVTAENSNTSFEDKVTLCERYALINSLNNLASFPWIQSRIENGNLLLHAWYFDLTTGLIYAFNEKEKSWTSL